MIIIAESTNIVVAVANTPGSDLEVTKLRILTLILCYRYNLCLVGCV